MLGPVLFILYTNHIKSVLKDLNETFLYPDVTSLIISSKNLEELEIRTYTGASVAKQYSGGYYLVLNKEKSQQMFFGPGDNSHELPLAHASADVK